MIDIRKLKELVKLMVENDLSELDLQDQEETVTIKRGVQGPILAQAPAHLMNHFPTAAPARSASIDHAADDGEDAAAQEPADAAPTGTPIESPMVGTFYAATTPDAPPFLKVGDSVGVGDVVCLVEAMKVFNEIKSEVAGTVTKVCVGNGDPVEFGQPLFFVR